jgi:hypothetical protein
MRYDEINLEPIWNTFVTSSTTLSRVRQESKKIPDAM